EIAESLGLDETSGALVSDPQEDAPAAQAGIRAGDIITMVNGETVEDPRELSRMIADIDPGSDVEITINRSGETSKIEVQLGQLPSDQVASVDEEPEQIDPAILEDFGLTLIPNDEGEGILVTAVEPGSDASEAGIRVGDIITEINNQEVSQIADVQELLDGVKADGRKAALLRLETNDRSRFVALPLA
ncbi:MAG: PDZ domain-containing protein, partial [Pseudomonadota bacterium]